MAAVTTPPPDEDDSSVVFDGINQDRQDALEIANFERAAKTPAKDDPGGTAKTRSGRTPEQLIGVATAVGGAMVLGMVSPLAGFIGFFAGGLAPAVVRFALEARGRPRRMSTRERFRIRLTEELITVESDSGRQEHPTANVLSFGAGKRIEIVHRDGTKAVLPCVLPSRQHGPLVEQLNALLATKRSSYR